MAGETPLGDVAGIAKARASSRARLLLDRLEKGDHVEILTWPTAEPDDPAARFAMAALSDDELQVAYAAAWERFRSLDLPVTPMNATEMHDEVNTQILARAMRVVDDDGAVTDELFFASADEFRSSLVGPARQRVRQFLVDAFLRVADEAEPSDMTQELAQEIYELAKKKDAPRLAGFGSGTLAAVLITMADRSAA